GRRRRPRSGARAAPGAGPRAGARPGRLRRARRPRGGPARRRLGPRGGHPARGDRPHGRRGVPGRRGSAGARRQRDGLGDLRPAERGAGPRLLVGPLAGDGARHGMPRRAALGEPRAEGALAPAPGVGLRARRLCAQRARRGQRRGRGGDGGGGRRRLVGADRAEEVDHLRPARRPVPRLREDGGEGGCPAGGARRAGARRPPPAGDHQHPRLHAGGAHVRRVPRAAGKPPGRPRLRAGGGDVGAGGGALQRGLRRGGARPRLPGRLARVCFGAGAVLRSHRRAPAGAADAGGHGGRLARSPLAVPARRLAAGRGRSGRRPGNLRGQVLRFYRRHPRRARRRADPRRQRLQRGLSRRTLPARLARVGDHRRKHADPAGHHRPRRAARVRARPGGVAPATGARL
ncbi:MAG: Acyl-CoA dehydrogenase, partial [uncultured Gemmatimonadetes bacterium]